MIFLYLIILYRIQLKLNSSLCIFKLFNFYIEELK